MTLDNYKVFYTVANEGQISKAASKLYISQPAVSQTIKQLENELDCLLFHRTPKGVVLTQEGKLFYQQIAEAFSHLRMAEQIIRDSKSLEVGEIRIGASDSVCSHYLLDILATYREHYPNIHVHIYNKTSRQVLDLLRTNMIDIGFVNMPISDDSQLTITQVKALQDCFVCSPSYGIDTSLTYALEDLAKMSLLVLEEGTHMRNYLDGIMKTYALDYQPTYELGSADLLLRFAAKNFGIAFVTREFSEEALLCNQVHILHIDKPIPPRGIGMVTTEHRQLSHAAMEFYQLCHKDQ